MCGYCHPLVGLPLLCSHNFGTFCCFVVVKIASWHRGECIYHNINLFLFSKYLYQNVSCLEHDVLSIEVKNNHSDSRVFSVVVWYELSIALAIYYSDDSW